MSFETGVTHTHRILVIDDNLAIHNDFRKILIGDSTRSGDELRTLASRLFGLDDELAEAGSPESVYEVDCANQGQSGCDMAAAAVAEGRPYEVAFVDIRMPPGWDGVRTIEELWKIDPEIQTVICSAYSDYSWTNIRERLGSSDRLLILRKPFDGIEINQLAAALTEKHKLARAARWQMGQLERLVRARTDELEAANARLESEVRQRRSAEEQLRHDVLHDRLTGLPNRAMLTDRLDQCLRRRQRDPHAAFGVLFIDLDDFKRINDSLGHDAGDQLLIAISQRFETALRETDAICRFCQGTAARLGGDEFVILLDGLQKPSDALIVAERIIDEMRRPVMIDGNEVVITLSIGVTTSSNDYRSAAEVLRDADTAVYRAKSGGKQRIAVFDTHMHAEAVDRVHLEADLRGAIGTEQIVVQYQPIISLVNGRVRGMEALVRWQHPTRGLIPPAEFIPLAESTGLLQPLGMQVLRTACVDLERWRKQSDALADLWVSVNLSTRQLQAPDLPERIDRVIAEVGLPGSSIHLEITESMVMQQGDAAWETARRLRQRQLSLVLDDFGTGYSALSQLHELPISCIKIDRSFITQMNLRARSYAATVQAIVALAHNCGFTVIAEGIETADQLAQLQTLDCDMAQGFFLCQPIPAERVGDFLAQTLAQNAWQHLLKLAA